MYIVIETFDKVFPYIVTDQDGMPLVFDSLKEANKEADNLQDGIVVEI